MAELDRLKKIEDCAISLICASCVPVTKENEVSVVTSIDVCMKNLEAAVGVPQWPSNKRPSKD